MATRPRLFRGTTIPVSARGEFIMLSPPCFNHFRREYSPHFTMICRWRFFCCAFMMRIFARFIFYALRTGDTYSLSAASPDLLRNGLHGEIIETPTLMRIRLRLFCSLRDNDSPSIRQLLKAHELRIGRDTGRDELAAMLVDFCRHAAWLHTARAWSMLMPARSAIIDEISWHHSHILHSKPPRRKCIVVNS